MEGVRVFIERFALMPAGARVLVGCSGGLDSTVLLVTLKRLGFAPEAAHINFLLRGDDSDRDEEHVQAFCAAWDTPCHVRRVATALHARSAGVSIQMAARTLRYEAMAALAQECQIGYVAVGHHSEDQAETLLINLFRGAGPEGLAGMPTTRSLGRATLVRPLLRQRRSDIRQFALTEGLSWRDDPSNRDATYLRGALRRHVLPVLTRVMGPGALPNAARSASLMREYVDASFVPASKKMFARAASEPGRLRLQTLTDVAPVWRRRLIIEALRRWIPGAPTSAVDSIILLIDSQPGRRVVLGSGTVWRGRHALHFSAGAAGMPEGIALLDAKRSVRIHAGTLRVTVLCERPEDLKAEAPMVAYVDGDLVEYPLSVRRWQAGDRMVPLGMQHSKKVSDILTDHKVPVNERKDAHVVLSGDYIVWLIGVRLAEPYRIRKNSRRFARFELSLHADS